MPLKPVHRSRVFWFGLAGLLFLGTWWIVPKHSVTLLTYTNIEGTGYGLEIRPDQCIFCAPDGWRPRFRDCNLACWSYPITGYDENVFTTNAWNQKASFPNYAFPLGWLVLWLAAFAIRRQLQSRRP
ncbi:MAG: hypothetical protein WCH40_02110 [Verrucomicrobiales bacterium]